MPVRMDCFGLTDLGRQRANNEDQFLIADLRKSIVVQQTSLPDERQSHLRSASQGRLLVVADGMGGHAAGERASTLAVDSLSTYVLNSTRWLFRLDDQCENDFVHDLEDAIKQCDRDLRSEMREVPDRSGMGTTVTLAYVLWPRLYVVHVGDSRCYLARGGRLARVTRDHTMAQALAERSGHAVEEATESRLSHILWNVIGGTTDEVEPEVRKAELHPGDDLLLCSDGLTRHIADPELLAYFAEPNATAESICQRLVAAANDAGGRDNITAIVARFRTEEVAV